VTEPTIILRGQGNQFPRLLFRGGSHTRALKVRGTGTHLGGLVRLEVAGKEAKSAWGGPFSGYDKRKLVLGKSEKEPGRKEVPGCVAREEVRSA